MDDNHDVNAELLLGLLEDLAVLTPTDYRNLEDRLDHAMTDHPSVPVLELLVEQAAAMRADRGRRHRLVPL